jgi:hypothetical protein
MQKYRAYYVVRSPDLLLNGKKWCFALIVSSCSEPGDNRLDLPLSATFHRQATHDIPGLAPLQQATHYVTRNRGNRRHQVRTCHLITVYAPPKRDTMNWVQPNYTPLTALTPLPPAVTSAGLATSFTSLALTTLFYAAHPRKLLTGYAATGPCAQR